MTVHGSRRQKYMLRHGLAGRSPRRRGMAFGLVSAVADAWRASVQVFDDQNTARMFMQRIKPLVKSVHGPTAVRGSGLYGVQYTPTSAANLRECLRVYKDLRSQARSVSKTPSAPSSSQLTRAEVSSRLQKPDYVIPKILGLRKTPFKPEESIEPGHPALQWWFGNPNVQAGRSGRVNVSKLTSVQDYVSPKNVIAVKGYASKPVQVIIHRGRPVLTDGNHRATRAWLDKQKHVPAEFYVMNDKGDFIPYTGDIRKFL